MKKLYLLSIIVLSLGTCSMLYAAAFEHEHNDEENIDNNAQPVIFIAPVDRRNLMGDEERAREEAAEPFLQNVVQRHNNALINNLNNLHFGRRNNLNNLNHAAAFENEDNDEENIDDIAQPMIFIAPVDIMAPERIAREEEALERLEHFNRHDAPIDNLIVDQQPNHIDKLHDIIITRTADDAETAEILKRYIQDNPTTIAMINMHNHQGITLLSRAIMWGKLEVMKILLKYNANPDLKNLPNPYNVIYSNSCFTSLMSAVEMRNRDAAKILIEAGASVNLSTHTDIDPATPYIEDLNPLSLAINQCNSALLNDDIDATLLEKDPKDMVAFLLDNYAAVNDERGLVFNALSKLPEEDRETIDELIERYKDRQIIYDASRFAE